MDNYASVCVCVYIFLLFRSFVLKSIDCFVWSMEKNDWWERQKQQSLNPASDFFYMC